MLGRRLICARHGDGTATYSYDNTDQVTGASYTGTGQPANEAYSYDANGNRTNTGYSTGANNRLLSDGTFNYVYDGEGNRTGRTRISTAPANDYLTTYGWDYRDRLTDVRFYNNSSVLTKHVHYVYDVFDHRISKSLDATGSGSYSRIEDYVYDGNHVILDFVDPDGAGPASLALATRYLNGPGAADAFDQVYAQEDAATGNVLWPLADNLGTTRDVVDNTGAVAGHFVYNSFGQLVSGPTNLTRYLYTGQAWDADAGLQYNWHRWYDPTVGRWISEDPIEFAAGDANLNRYVHNASPNRVDPTGFADGFWDSIGDSVWSMGQTYVAMAQYVTGDPTYSQTFQNAYEAGPLGQTHSSSGVYYYGARGSLAVAAGCAVAAGGIGSAEYLLLGNQSLAEINICSSGNVFKIISRPFRGGFRIDRAHYGKPWGHHHLWWW